jgi:hypothetical protein
VETGQGGITARLGSAVEEPSDRLLDAIAVAYSDFAFAFAAPELYLGAERCCYSRQVPVQS